MEFNPMAFVTSLRYLVSGWLGIFVVIGVIILITMLLNRALAPKQDEDTK